MSTPTTPKWLATVLLSFFACFLSAPKASAQCTATLTITDTAICADSFTHLQAFPGGLYDYQWFVNGQLGPLGNETWDFSEWTPGTYTFEVQITDNNNCTVISNPVTVTVYPQPQVYVSGGGVPCIGSSYQFIASGQNATTYTWTGPNNFSANNDTITISNFQTSDIGYYQVVASNNGCSSWPSSGYVDTIPSTQTLGITLWNWYNNNSNDLCEGDYIDMIASASGIMNASWSWTGPNNFTSNSDYVWTYNTTVADSGVYTVTVSGATCSGTVTLTDTIQLHVHQTPVVSVTSNGPVCPGTTFVMNATVSNATSYGWTGPNNFTSTLLTDSIVNMQAINSGGYTFTAMNGMCDAGGVADGTVLTNSPSYTSWIWDTNIVHCAGQYGYIDIWNIVDINNPVITISGPNGFISSNSWTNVVFNSNSDSGVYYINVSGTGNCGNGAISLTDSFVFDVRPCVWPGDVNNDLITDNFDVLDLGLAYAQQGPQRPGANYGWNGQYMTDWGVMQFCGQDMKFADCNGNGIITASDTFGIALNYSQTHVKGAHIPQPKVTANPDLYFDMTGITLTPGATVSIPIKLGTSTIPMVNVYGLAAQVKISGITPASDMVVTAPAGWMGSLADALNFNKIIGSNQTDWAYVRTDHNNANGFGTIAQLQFTVPQGSQYQQVQLWFDNVKIIGNTGNVITTVNILDDTATIVPVGLSTPEVTVNDAYVVPNPSEGQASLHISGVQDGEMQIIVTDVTGKLVWNKTSRISKGIQQIELPADVAPGMYAIQITDSKGMIEKTMKWVKK
jgi:hypothetical protein